MTESRPFFEFWRTRAAFIEKLDPRENFYEANALPWAALDALAWAWARCRRPELNRGGRARRRMGDFLAQHGGEPFRRISSPALWARADALDPAAVRADVLNRLLRFGGRREPTLIERQQSRLVTQDPLADDVLTAFADIAAEKIKVTKNETTVQDFVLASRFGEIAYTEMRCSILHEGRLGDGAHGFDLGDDGPTYLSGVFGTPPSIGFSANYMVKVLRTCIDGFELESREAGVDPVPPPRGCILLDLDGESEA